MDAHDIDAVVTEEWRAALDAHDADRDQDFFAAGGNSMMAMAMARRIEARLGIAFPMDVLFVDGTLSSVMDACAHQSARR